jgi:hypothetical protein
MSVMGPSTEIEPSNFARMISMQAANDVDTISTDHQATDRQLFQRCQSICNSRVLSKLMCFCIVSTSATSHLSPSCSSCRPWKFAHGLHTTMGFAHSIQRG